MSSWSWSSPAGARRAGHRHRGERPGAVPERQRRRGHHPLGRAVGQQARHALHRHLGLAVVGAEAGGPPGQVGEHGDGAGEQADVAERWPRPRRGRGRRAARRGRSRGCRWRPTTCAAPAWPPGRPSRRRPRGLAELVEAAGDGRLGAGDLDRADGAEHVADEPGDRGGGLALAPAPRPQPVAEHAAEHEGEQHRHDDDAASPARRRPP